MRAERLHYDLSDCSIAGALEVLGEKWSLLIVREAFYGLKRFDEFAEALGIGRAVLAQRLKTLTGAGIFEAARYRRPGHRARAEYRLTDKGRALLPVILSLSQWAEAWTPSDAGPTLAVTHAGCGGEITVGLTCAVGHEAIDPALVALAPGPGARRIG